MSQTPTIRDSQGRIVPLGPSIGTGGEGAVYIVQDDPKVVAKVYHKPVDKEHAEKLRALSHCRTNALSKIAAWPVDTLHAGLKGDVAGLKMPRVIGKPIHLLYSPKSRLTEFPNASWSFLLRAAANLARAFAVVHEHGHVIADVNHGNALVSDQALVRLIDCDSFQISTPDRAFLCGVGVDTHTPPELQEGSRKVLRTANHDAFGLAVLIFQLLFMGRHPFSGQYLGSGDMPLDRSIKELRFAYGSSAASRQMRQPPHTLALTSVSPRAMDLFERAFSRQGSQAGSRPTARDWIQAIEEIDLKDCGRNPAHKFLASLATCPWCELEASSGALLFHFIVPVQTAAGGFDLLAIWSQVTSVPPPAPLPQAPDPQSFPSTPSPASIQAGRARFKRQVLAIVTGLGGIGIGIAFFTESGCAGIAVMGIALFIASSILEQARSLRGPAQRALQDTRNQLMAEEARWRSEAGDDSFQAKLAALQKLRQEYLDLPMTRQRKLNELQRNLRVNQLQRFLNRHRIEDGKISGIGSSRKATLQSYGIETAYDLVEHRILQVPGFGPVFTNNLLDWRRSIERHFVFNPGVGVDPADITKLDRDLATRRFQIEKELLGAPVELRQIGQQIAYRRQVLRPQLENAALKVAQAMADLKAS